MKKKVILKIAFSVILLVSLVYVVLAEEIDWGTQVYNAMMSIPQGTNQFQKAIVVYQKYYDDSNKLYTENAKRTFQDPELDRCANACGNMPTGGNPGDIDIDNPDAWHQKNAMTFDQWAACRKKCNTEYDAREDKINAELNEKVKLLAEKAIADINAIKSGSTVTSDSDTPNTNENRGRDTYQRINPSFGGYLGDAYVVRSDGTKVIPGKELYLKVDDRIVTGANSKLNFIFKDVGGINLGKNTQLRVGNALLDQYYLARGTLKTQINWGTLPPQKLEFHTPNAVIKIKGTEFVLEYNETTNTTIVYLNEGVLGINIRGNIINLTTGNYLVVNSDGSVWKYLLKSEKWNDLENNFYEIPDADKITQIIIWGLFIVDIITILILTLWMGKKIKNTNKNDKSTTNGTASLVLGILGLVIFIAPYIGVILSTVGLFLARIQKVNKPTKSATAGLILGILGLILNMIILIMML